MVMSENRQLLRELLCIISIWKRQQTSTQILIFVIEQFAAAMRASMDGSLRQSLRRAFIVGPFARHQRRRHLMCAFIPALRLRRLPDFAPVAVAIPRPALARQIGMYGPTWWRGRCA